MTWGDPGAIDVKSSDWLYVGAVAIIVAAWFFRVEMIRLTLRLLMRGLSAYKYRSINGAIREFEKLVLYPLSYVCFGVFVLIALSIAGALAYPTVNTIVQILIGIPMFWTVIQFCTFLNVIIIRRQGWERSNSKDDSSKIMMVTEGIGVLQYLLCAVVFYYFFLNQLQVDTIEIFTTIILVLELLFVLSSHTWFRNVMGGLILLIDEPIKSGSHIKLLEHEGVVEHMYLQFFTVRQYDQGLAIIPNSMLLQYEVQVRSKSLDGRIVIDIPLAHNTPPKLVREFVRNADRYLTQHYATTSKATIAEEIFTPAKQSKVSLNDVLRQAVNKTKEKSKATDVHQYWVTVIGLYHVQVVYFVPSPKFKHIINEKRELTLGLTKLLTSMKLSLHEPNNTQEEQTPPRQPRRQPEIHPFEDDEAYEARVGFEMPVSSVSYRRNPFAE
ncbi:hypothetical protein THRCLA_06225 [Thraustotheca clavata]|uniref:Mechanosensitive ion channel MscS domain-containing protein n=1 Tax=Thraustotheca clavata TaxID=74557 RepID=A0A1V9ZQ51_9STRA|nr:hypothetical protein THRCLA_06225 [Thraustotheca clavata]